MSLDKLRTGDKPSRCLIGEGRREEAGQRPAPSHRSGGVGVGGTSVSSVKVSWEVSGGGCKTQPSVQAGYSREAGGVAGEVGVLRSSDETPATGVERRRGTCSGVRREGGRWLRKEIRRHDELIINPDFGSRPKGADRTGLGEPNMGNPSVRFDEGRSGSAGLTTAVSSKPPPSTSPTLPNQVIFMPPHPRFSCPKAQHFPPSGTLASVGSPRRGDRGRLGDPSTSDVFAWSKS